MAQFTGQQEILAQALQAEIEAIAKRHGVCWCEVERVFYHGIGTPLAEAACTAAEAELAQFLHGLLDLAGHVCVAK